MDYFGLQFFSGTGLANHGYFGTELVFTARETTLAMIAAEPWTNDIYNTEGGFTGSLPRRNPRTFTFTVQLLDARTLGKLDIIHTMTSLGYRCRFNIKNGYLLSNNAANTLFNNGFGMPCTLDYGTMEARDIRQAVGPVWKRGQQIIVRESLELTRPTAGDIVIASGGTKGN